MLLLDGLPLPDRGNLEVRSVLNCGGFINRSFRLTSGGCNYHLKLTSDAHSLRGLERWRTLSASLCERYLAPAMRGWIEIPGTSLAGPLFDWVGGTPPDAVHGVVRDLSTAAVGRLHADHLFARDLRQLGDAVTSCAEAYRATYHERFVEDLKLVRAEPPPFIATKLLEWMTEEAGEMARRADESAAFAAPADVATHRDLWLDNLLVTPDGALFILDWDEMGLGDPMMDWAMLSGPSRSRVAPAKEADLPDSDFSAAQRERFAHYARASVLDWIIDPLADWVDAAREPEHGAAVRESNRRVFEDALACYRKLYRVPGGLT